jgi:hypothetical protein
MFVFSGKEDEEENEMKNNEYVNQKQSSSPQVSYQRKSHLK